MAALLIAAGMTIPASADEPQLTLETNIDKTLEIPLKLTSSTENFYMNANINPGDVMKADVVFKNTSNSPIQVRIAEISDQLGTTDSARLLDVLDLTITVNGSNIYKGSHKDVTSPITQWLTLEGGDLLTMNVEIEFPKWEADNTFQGSEMKAKYVFEARAEIEEETTAAPPQIIKTGVEDDTPSNPMLVPLIGAAGVCVGIVIIIFIKKDKDKNKDEK